MISGFKNPQNILPIEELLNGDLHKFTLKRKYTGWKLGIRLKNIKGKIGEDLAKCLHKKPNLNFVPVCQWLRSVIFVCANCLSHPPQISRQNNTDTFYKCLVFFYHKKRSCLFHGKSPSLVMLWESQLNCSISILLNFINNQNCSIKKKNLGSH